MPRGPLLLLQTLSASQAPLPLPQRPLPLEQPPVLRAETRLLSPERNLSGRGEEDPGVQEHSPRGSAAASASLGSSNTPSRPRAQPAEGHPQATLWRQPFPLLVTLESSSRRHESFRSQLAAATSQAGCGWLRRGGPGAEPESGGGGGPRVAPPKPDAGKCGCQCVCVGGDRAGTSSSVAGGAEVRPGAQLCMCECVCVHVCVQGKA